MAEFDDAAAMLRPNQLSLVVREKSALFAAYMPFLRGGGVFVPSMASFELGEPISLTLSLLDDPGSLSLGGRVAWVTPSSSQAGRTRGVGVQFNDDEAGRRAKHRIETLLGGAIKSSRPTHTM